MEKNAYLHVKGLEPIFLGSFRNDHNLVEALEELQVELGIDIQVLDDHYQPARRAFANPAENDSFQTLDDLGPDELKSLIEQSLNAPYLALNNAIKGEGFCTIGEPRRITYPIRSEDIESISKEIAGLHLVALIPNQFRKLPKSVKDAFKNSTYFTQAQFDELKENEQKKVREIVDEFSLSTLLRGNTKLEKNKVPSTLNIGEPSDIDGYNQTITQGSAGLNFLPAGQLLWDDTAEPKQRSFRTIVKEYHRLVSAKLTGFDGNLSPIEQQKIKDLNSFIKNPDTFIKKKKAYKGTTPPSTRDLEDLEISLGLSSGILDDSSFQQRNKTVCMFSSKQCRATCLVSTGRRGMNTADPFGMSQSLDEGHTRLLLGYLQTGFIANPYYFFRILIDGIHALHSKRMKEICNENASNYARGLYDLVVDIKDYEELLPTSVRLNLYSDYPWETIYPDLFKIFAIDRTQYKPFLNYPRTPVMFYDYTKVPGRWDKSKRLEFAKKHKIQLSPLNRNYELPKNYDITFSFSGTPKSYLHQELALRAGQFATVVFSSASLVEEAISEAFKHTKKTFKGLSGEELYNQKILPLISKIETRLKETFCNGATHHKITKTSEHLRKHLPTHLRIPKTFAGYRVVSGDLYDLRYLDKHLKNSPDESLIIGLAWKTPKTIKIDVNGKTYPMDPAFCALLLDKEQQFEDERTQKTLEMGVGFAVNMYSFGTVVKLTEEDITNCFTIFITSKSTTQESTIGLLSQLSEIDIDRLEIDNITYASETGATMNFSDGVQTFEFQLDQLMSKTLDQVSSDDEA